MALCIQVSMLHRTQMYTWPTVNTAQDLVGSNSLAIIHMSRLQLWWCLSTKVFRAGGARHHWCNIVHGHNGAESPHLWRQTPELQWCMSLPTYLSAIHGNAWVININLFWRYSFLSTTQPPHDLHIVGSLSLTFSIMEAVMTPIITMNTPSCFIYLDMDKYTSNCNVSIQWRWWYRTDDLLSIRLGLIISFLLL